MWTATTNFLKMGVCNKNSKFEQGESSFNAPIIHVFNLVQPVNSQKPRPYLSYFLILKLSFFLYRFFGRFTGRITWKISKMISKNRIISLGSYLTQYGLIQDWFRLEVPLTDRNFLP